VPASPTERSLCVSIHDVAPDTWAQCRCLLAAVRAVADIPLTLLVVPQYHGNAALPRAYESALGALLAQGHELALHGYTHLDTQARHARRFQRFLRTVYTRGEGEFSALDAAQARQRIELGLAWFARRHFPVNGFVAPAWLLSEAAWRVLRDYPFEYTSTFWRFHRLRTQRGAQQAVFSPSLVYSTRNGVAKALSCHGADALACGLRVAPLVRLGLHPRDACFPELVRHFQHVLAGLLATRHACTKLGFARGTWG
jgi:uncharacterized protein